MHSTAAAAAQFNWIYWRASNHALPPVAVCVRAMDGRLKCERARAQMIAPSGVNIYNTNLLFYAISTSQHIPESWQCARDKSFQYIITIFNGNTSRVEEVKLTWIVKFVWPHTHTHFKNTDIIIDKSCAHRKWLTR